MFGQDVIPIKREATYDKGNAACPNEEMPYWIEYDKDYSRIDWKITGGSFFHNGSWVKEIENSLSTTVTVVWENVASVNNSIPKGSIIVKVYKNSTLKADGKRNQEIASLKGVAMGELKIENDVVGTELLSGKHQFRILIHPINYPGIKFPNGQSVPVTKYECTLPKGWKSGEKQGSFEVSLHGALAFVDLVTDDESEGAVKIRAINKRLHCEDTKDFSNYSQIAFTRKKLKLVDFPKEISITSKLTYNFSVEPWQGSHIYEWEAPLGWRINDGGNTYSGENAYSVKITPNACYTEDSVKVRIKSLKPGYWKGFKTIITKPIIKKPDEITQYQSSNFSLDIADDKISYVEWFIDDVLVAKETGKSETQLSFYKSGDVKVSAKLSMKDCDMLSISNLQATVRPTPLQISGPSSFCDKATYSIERLPEGARVKWSANDNLSLVSGQETASALFSKQNNGIGWVKALVKIEGLSVSLQKEKIQIGAFKPRILICERASLLAVESGCIGGQFYCTVFGKEISEDMNDYEWEIIYPKDNYPGFSIPKQLGFIVAPDLSVDDLDGRHSFFSIGKEVDFSATEEGTYKIRLKYKGDCGWSDGIEREFSCRTYCDDGKGNDHFPFRLYPNPAKDHVMVQLYDNVKTEENTFIDPSLRLTTQSNESGIYEIQIWNNTSLLRKQTCIGHLTQVSLNGLQKGLYYVLLIKDGKIDQQKLIIE